MEPLSTDNRTNTIARWQAALQQLTAERATADDDDGRDFALNVVVALDTSGSMAGKRLNAVKLGLCSLVAALDARDRVYLLTFNSSINDLTGGAVRASELLPMLPGLLTAMKAEGSTAFYDTVSRCLDIARATFGDGAAPAAVAAVDTAVDTAVTTAVTTAGATGAAHPALPIVNRTVVVALTDGEDTMSNGSVEAVRVMLRAPPTDRFMFITVTVDVEQRILGVLRPWFVFAHCKRIDVTVKTGRRLIGVFTETMLLRMLRPDTEDDGATAESGGIGLAFFSRARGLVVREGEADMPMPVTDDAPPPYSVGDTPVRAFNGPLDDDMDGDDSDDENAGAPTGGGSRYRSSSPMYAACYSDDEG